jgi:hypothetical protein
MASETILVNYRHNILGLEEEEKNKKLLSLNENCWQTFREY